MLLTRGMRIDSNPTCNVREVGVRAFGSGSPHSEPSAKRSTGIRTRPVRGVVAAVNLDLGCDNAIFIRGQGGGLSWDRGQPLTLVDAQTWVWSPDDRKDKLEFQLLLDDEVWERGQKHVLEPGDSIELTPDFEWPDMPRTA